MDHVLTLVVNPALCALIDRDLEAARDIVAQKGGVPESKTNWLSPEKAAEFILPSASSLDPLTIVDEIENHFRGEDKKVDLALQPQINRRKKLLISDMDSTMITVECIDEIAAEIGRRDEIADITERAMCGELDFAEALRTRVRLLEGLETARLDKICRERIRFSPGGKALIATMRASGAYTILVSGGFSFFTRYVAAELGFDAERANRLEEHGGRLTGAVVAPILGAEAKLSTLRQELTRLKLKPIDSLALGDGANDLLMIEAAGLGISYTGKPLLRRDALARIETGDLTSALYFQGYSEDDILTP